MSITIKKQIEIYVTITGKKPFTEWLEAIKNREIRYRIKARLNQIMLGNLGDYKFVGNGVFELRLKFESGYRIYYGNDGEKIIVLLCAGDKKTQKRDIKKAIIYWQDYLSR